MIMLLDCLADCASDGTARARLNNTAAETVAIILFILICDVYFKMLFQGAFLLSSGLRNKAC